EGMRVRQPSAKGRFGGPQSPPLGGRYPRVHLQRRALRIGRSFGRIHEELRLNPDRNRELENATMAKVLISDTLSEDGLAVLKKAPGIEFEYKPGLSEDDLAAAIVGFDGLVIRSGSKVTAKVLAKADKLKVVGRAGIGVDN